MYVSGLELLKGQRSRVCRAIGGLPVTTGFRVDSRASSVSFTQVATLIPGDTPYGAYGGDLDRDGDLDLAIPNEDTSDVSVFLNLGGNVFSQPRNYITGWRSSSLAAADLNGDGYPEIGFANSGAVNRLFLNVAAERRGNE